MKVFNLLLHCLIKMQMCSYQVKFDISNYEFVESNFEFVQTNSQYDHTNSEF